MLKTTIATSIKYGNYKALMGRVEKIQALLKHYAKAFKAEFDYNPSVVVHMRPIKGNTHGRAFFNKPLIEIDPRYKFRNIVETIAHELTHSEQYKQGRLKHIIGSKQSVWENRTMSRGSTHAQYLALPWEVEARKRAKEFVDKYFTHAYLDIAK